jgi:hypothetical protein
MWLVDTWGHAYLWDREELVIQSKESGGFFLHIQKPDGEVTTMEGRNWPGCVLNSDIMRKIMEARYVREHNTFYLFQVG